MIGYIIGDMTAYWLTNLEEKKASKEASISTDGRPDSQDGMGEAAVGDLCLGSELSQMNKR